jgi:hypothetical protein
VVIIVVGPQYRAGLHRQFVSLARTLSTAGFLVLRYDYRGMGDSDGEYLGHTLSKTIPLAAHLQLNTAPIGQTTFIRICRRQFLGSD